MILPTPQTAYMDSSALVKRYMAEAGTAWVQAWCNDPDHAVTVAEIGLVEVAATFAGKLRGGFITSKEYQDARNDLWIDAQSEYALVAVNRSLVDEAIGLTARHRLRGYDAVHLACALFANRTLVEQGLPPLVFVCADNALLTAASAEGLATDDPNNPL